MNINKAYYETSNLPLSAIILCWGVPLESVNKLPDGRSVFVFHNSKSLEEVIENFWKRTLTVEPNSFWETIRFLKSRIYGNDSSPMKGDTND